MNASTILHLNPTATEIAYHIIKQSSDEEIVAEFVKRYRVDAETASQDLQDFQDRLHTLIHTPDLDPEVFLDVSRVDPHSSYLSAPLRLDCALTYQMSDGSSSVFAPVDRVKRISIRNGNHHHQSLACGSPHIVFTVVSQRFVLLFLTDSGC